MPEEDKDTLARTIYGEARGEYPRKDGGLASLIAVANVILNRSKNNKRRFGRTVRDVCLKPLQFSCWNEKDLNRKMIEAIDSNHPLFQLCLNVAEKTMDGVWPDLTKGSDHYHADYVLPNWTQGQDYQVKIGRHLFYKLER